MTNRSRTPTALLAWISALILLLPTSQRAQAQDCPVLADLRIEDTNLLSATAVPASGDLPAYCSVVGYVRPAINFEIRLPTAGWNGKFYMAGCGGYCGKVFIDDSNRGLRRNYAVAAMDAGHWGEDWRDGTWAYNDRQAEIDWAHRAVHETARVTKLIIEAFYGRGPEHSYFQGCSTGGRQAVMEAWRYPDDFDGIISHDPVLDQTGIALLQAWLAQINTGPDGKNIVTAADAQLVEEAVYEACDPLDGLEDGLISDPRTCHFDPATLACQEDKASGCLTAEQVEVVQKMYDGPRDPGGRQLYPGLLLGSEPHWGFWITGETAEVGDDLIPQLYVEYMRYLAFPKDPGSRYEIEDFDFDRDPQRLEPMGQIYNADHPDLDAFRERDGKLLMVQGWADPNVPAVGTIDYYEKVEEHVGSRRTTQGFFRLFTVPGMDHCGIGEGPGIIDAGIDPLTALERWVEQGEAPTNLITTKTDSTGAALWTRPICPYPQRAVYDGEGDPDEASSFECVIP